MKTSFPRAIVALLALTFVAVACASETGSQWTYAPLTANDTEVEVIADGDATAGSAGASAGETSAGSTGEQSAASGDARVIELQATASLQFTDMAGQQVQEIPVTPGETVVFRVDNTANFDHNLYIGTDEELSVPNATTDVGIPTWRSGVQELEWTVPDDISGLKYGCTIPGHYANMQGVFTLADAGTATEAGSATEAPAAEEPTAEEPAADQPADTTATEAPAGEEPAAAPSEDGAAPASDGAPRVIDLEADAAIRFMQDGQQVNQIPVTPGETVIFRIDNTANFPHNFWIGPDDELQVPNGDTDVGLPDWTSGVQELEWTVPEDISGLRFACTVPGHYFTMQGDFVISE